MFNLIGLGMDLESISLEAREVCKQADKVYLEAYTVDFPYRQEKLSDIVGNKVIPLTRMMVEAEDFVDEAKDKNIVLLVYGSPLVATTHISLIMRCKKLGIDYKIYHNASIVDAVVESGLQIYKFGKIASMPKWDKEYRPTSFISLIKDNQKISAHTLILIDIGLSFPDALRQLTEASKDEIKLDKIIVCSGLGTKKGKIYYSKIDELFGAEAIPPYCLIIPSELHFAEKEALEAIKEKL